jgi:hypothetical protein
VRNGMGVILNMRCNNSKPRRTAVVKTGGDSHEPH